MQVNEGGIRKAGRQMSLRAVLASAAMTLAVTTPAQAISLAEAVRSALQTNPDIGIVAENKRAVEYELDQARGQYYPVVDYTGSAGYEATRDGTSFARGEAEGSFGMPTYSSSLTLTQMIFDGRATDADVARQESRVVSATRRVRETSEFIGLDAIEAYMESLRQRELAAIAEDNVRQHELTLELVETKAAGGAATTADVQQAESRLAAAQATLTEAEARLRDADATYVRVIGESPKELVRPVPPIWALPQTLEDAVAISLRNNPTVAVTRADLETVRQEFRAGKAAFWPTVNLELNGNAARNEDGSRGADLSASALIRVNYNLYRGGRDSNRVQELIHRIGEARQRHNRALRLTEEEMRLAWNALTSSRDRLAAQRREVEANDRVRETYRQQFNVGGRNLLELLDAENELFIAKGNLVTTEFLELFSIYRILATGGVLMAALDVPQIGEGRSELDPRPPEGVNLERSFGATSGGRPGGGDILDPDLDPLGPLDSTQGLDPLAPLDPNAPLDPLAPLDPNASGGSGGTLDPNAPLDPLAPLDPNAPLDPLAPLDPNASLDGIPVEPVVRTEALPPPTPTAQLDGPVVDANSYKSTLQGPPSFTSDDGRSAGMRSYQAEPIGPPVSILTRAVGETPYSLFDE
ncbi:MAG: TolC family outer membrane protein [Alphaproteobacteria bacterium]|nr:TolC family outer membrane protein [Alphaproteobacteria bacterium]MBO6864421.1 TolC family outer membrane protein [Alphaproteobacteria bacterium]